MSDLAHGQIAGYGTSKTGISGTGGSMNSDSIGRNRAGSAKRCGNRKKQFKVAQPATSELPVFWSVRALHLHWRISRQQLYEAHRSGRLRGFRIFGTLRFLEDDLIEYLKQAGVPEEKFREGETKISRRSGVEDFDRRNNRGD